MAVELKSNRSCNHPMTLVSLQCVWQSPVCSLATGVGWQPSRQLVY